MNVNGKVPRIHGNKGRKPHNSLKYNEIKHCVDFVLYYCNEHGLPQPAAPRGRDGEPPVYLAASLTKYSLHKEYVAEQNRYRTYQIYTQAKFLKGV